MKLSDFFRRDWKRQRRDDLVVPTGRGDEMVDRSSMADLARLLKEADDAQQSSRPQPA